VIKDNNNRTSTQYSKTSHTLRTLKVIKEVSTIAENEAGWLGTHTNNTEGQVFCRRRHNTAVQNHITCHTQKIIINARTFFFTDLVVHLLYSKLLSNQIIIRVQWILYKNPPHSLAKLSRKYNVAAKLIWECSIETSSC